MLGLGSDWKLGLGGVILSLDVPLDGENCCMNYKVASEQACEWKAVAALSHTAKCFAMQYLLLPWRQNVLCIIVFAPVLSAPLKRGSLNRYEEEGGCRSPRKEHQS